MSHAPGIVVGDCWTPWAGSGVWRCTECQGVVECKTVKGKVLKVPGDHPSWMGHESGCARSAS